MSNQRNYEERYYCFLYFEVLNVSFSLESMISAFAITNDVIVIILSLIINTIKNLKISICCKHPANTALPSDPISLNLVPT
nr:DUF475 domain-containing protein [Acinetobacter lwoffii]